MQKHIISLANRKAAVAAERPARMRYSVPFADRLKEYSDRAHSPEATRTPSSKILVGEISQSRQTVSDLLMHHSQLKNKTWDILSARENANKDYRTLTPGTKIYYSGTDKSLSWVGAEQSSQSSLPHAVATSQLMPNGSPLEPAAVETIQLGVIGKSSPTVSHLLHGHSAYRHETWQILSNHINSSKDFKSIPVGVSVQIDPITREIRWQSPENISRTQIVQTGEEAGPTEVAMAAAADITDPLRSTSIADEPVLLGTIDSRNPTVSHLLRYHAEFANRLWALLGNSANREKPFHEIASGTEIYLHPDSQEIIWGQSGMSSQRGAQTIEPAHLPVKNIQDVDIVVAQEKSKTTPAADLTEAVRPYLGSPYKEVNCYELLVKGLERMDIPYTGKGGLLSKLTQMARDKGLPANAFMNGEGIVKAAGSLVLSKSYPKTSNWKHEAEQLYKEMEPLLDKGQILSFSTNKRGHTGIISQHHNEWTFINSGRMDNSLTKNSPSNGVGEEVLKKEIRNWFKLANSSRESLMVTLGSIGQEKVMTAFNQSVPSEDIGSVASAESATKRNPVALRL